MINAASTYSGSGFDADYERALTPNQLLAKLRSGWAYSISEAAQFQIILVEWEVTRRPTAREAIGNGAGAWHGQKLRAL